MPLGVTRVAREVGNRWLGAVAAARRRMAGGRRDLAVWADIRAFPPIAIWAGVLCVAGLALVRRLSDPAALKLTGPQVGATATFLAVLALVVRALLGRCESARPARWIRGLATSAAIWPFLVLALCGSRRVPFEVRGYVVALAGIVGAFAWCWSRAFMERFVVAMLLPSAENRPRLTGQGAPPVSSTAVVPQTQSHPVSKEQPAPRTGAGMWLERSPDDAGNDCLHGASTATIAAGQSLVTLHVPFCPVFFAIPEFTCETLASPTVRIKGTAVFPYGARVELKRTGDTSSPIAVEVRFCARQALQSARAA
ncbi:MAG: hypothetical protein ACKV0T_07590 [Planctomycetales bacterium]